MITKQASEIAIGETLCEPDGFMWKVISSRKTKRGFLFFKLSPVHKTAIGECEHEIKIKSMSLVRVYQSGPVIGMVRPTIRQEIAARLRVWLRGRIRPQKPHSYNMVLGIGRVSKRQDRPFIGHSVITDTFYSGIGE